MQPETYVLLHRMIDAATTEHEIKIVLRRFHEIIEAKSDSDNREDIFDAAWAFCCLAGLYNNLYEPVLAEWSYLESIRLFEKNGMVLNAATLCVSLSKFFAAQGRFADAEIQLARNVAYLRKHWGGDSNQVHSAEEELKHFQLTREIINACQHVWCRACNVDDYGVGLDAEGR
ncbi:MAG TPA: hypothetical protein V6D17_22650 [Candidatus Obscuribacterales bacterium]